MGVGRGGAPRCGESDSLDRAGARLQQIVGAGLDPLRHVGVRRAAVRRVVFEAAAVGGIVRGRDDDAVGETGLAPAVVGQDGVRYGRASGCIRRRAEIMTSTPLAASTSRAVANAGADSA